jgi:hypothetical protein
MAVNPSVTQINNYETTADTTWCVSVLLNVPLNTYRPALNFVDCYYVAIS